MAEKQISEFNEAAFQISRLHNKWLQFSHLLEQGSLILCKWKLDTIGIELWNDAKRLDGEETPEETKEDKENKYVNKLIKVDKEIVDAEKEKDKGKLYFTLLKKAKLLKEIQDDAGKGARYRPADDEYTM